MKLNANKKIYLVFSAVVGLILILIVVVAVLALKDKGNTNQPSANKPPINEPINSISLSQRPYIFLKPRNDGREVTLTLQTLNKSANELEYELEYQAGTLLQGAFGAIDLILEPPPVSKDILLGSCSAGGACSFHKDVLGGTLIGRFRGDDNYVVKSEWRFQDTTEADGQFSSRDSKFQLDAGPLLNQSSYIITMQTSGLPDEAPGEIISGPYGIFPSQGLPQTGQAELTMRLSQDSQTATIYGWDGAKWQSFDTILDGKTATATVDFSWIYIATQ